MKTKTSLRLFTLAATTLLAGAATGRAQTILNPSFENPATTSYVDGGGDNWSLTAGTALIQSNSLGRGTTPYGTQFLYLRPASTDAQTVGAFTLGQIYTFTLAVADAQFLPNDSITLSVSGGATASQSYSIPESSSQNFPFVDYTVTFIPLTSTTVTLAVTNTSSYDANGGSIAVDNARVAVGTLAVPEPSTWAALCLGVAGLGVVTLRRRA